MSTLRIIHDNAVDRATIVASSTAGALVAANLKNDTKSYVHRSVGTSVTYTLTWASPETVGGAGLPATNLSPEAQIRVRGYDAVDALLMDSGWKYAAPGAILGLWDWTLPLNVNAFSFGGATKAAVWFEEHFAVRKLTIELSDPTNAAGYIDNARLVAGGYWATQYNPDYGSEQNIVDQSASNRNDAGDNLTDRGTMYDTMNLNMSYMPAQDRARISQIMRSNGAARPLFVSVLSENPDPLLEQDWIIYGKRQNAGISFASFSSHTTQINIEGW